MSLEEDNIQGLLKNINKENLTIYGVKVPAKFFEEACFIVQLGWIGGNKINKEVVSTIINRIKTGKEYYFINPLFPEVPNPRLANLNDEILRCKKDKTDEQE